MDKMRKNMLAAQIEVEKSEALKRVKEAERKAQRELEAASKERVEEQKRESEKRLHEERILRLEREFRAKAENEQRALEERQQLERARIAKIEQEAMERAERKLRDETEKQKRESELRIQLEQRIRAEILAERKAEQEWFTHEQLRKEQIQRQISESFEQKKRQEEELRQYKEDLYLRAKLETDKALEEKKREYDIKILETNLRQEHERVIEEKLKSASLKDFGSPAMTAEMDVLKYQTGGPSEDAVPALSRATLQLRSSFPTTPLQNTRQWFEFVSDRRFQDEEQELRHQMRPIPQQQSIRPHTIRPDQQFGHAGYPWNQVTGDEIPVSTRRHYHGTSRQNTPHTGANLQMPIPIVNNAIPQRLRAFDSPAAFSTATSGYSDEDEGHNEKGTNFRAKGSSTSSENELLQVQKLAHVTTGLPPLHAYVEEVDDFDSENTTPRTPRNNVKDSDAEDKSVVHTIADLEDDSEPPSISLRKNRQSKKPFKAKKVQSKKTDSEPSVQKADLKSDTGSTAPSELLSQSSRGKPRRRRRGRSQKNQVPPSVPVPPNFEKEVLGFPPPLTERDLSVIVPRQATNTKRLNNWKNTNEQREHKSSNYSSQELGSSSRQGASQHTSKIRRMPSLEPRPVWKNDT
jgi:hypothetical protein